MNDEDFRSRLLTELSEEEPPPLGGLVAGALGDGVRLRRRHRYTQVLGATAGVTAVAVAAIGLANSGVAHSGGVSAASGTAIDATPVASTTTADPTATGDAAKQDAAAKEKAIKEGKAPAQPANGGGSTPAPPKNWQPAPAWMTGPAYTKPAPGTAATGQAVAAVEIADLEKLGGTPTHVTGYDPSMIAKGQNGDRGGYSSDMFWNQSSVGIRVFAPAQATPTGCWPNSDTTVCEDYKLADGTVVNYFYIKGNANTVDVKDGKSQANLTITRPDGTQIVVIELNGRQNGNYGADRADLPLTEQQLWAIADDQRLGTVMAKDFVRHADQTITLAPDVY